MMRLTSLMCACLVLACAAAVMAQQPMPTVCPHAAVEAVETQDDQNIQFWVGTFEDYAAEGIPYGCGSYLLPVDSGIPRSDDTIEDLRIALEALLNPELAHPQAETEDWLRSLGLSVEEITLDAGEAVITLGGELLGIGSCGDAIMEGQILQTIFQIEAIERVKVSDGDTNLREIIDMSDSLSAEERRNYIYARLEN